MAILKGLTKIVLSPINGVAEVIKDVKGDNGESQQGLSILTIGVSSVVKGTGKAIVNGVDDIFN